MVMLFYIEALAAYITFTFLYDFIMSLPLLYNSELGISEQNGSQIISALITIIIYMFITALWVVIHFFRQFHIKIMEENKTTLEHLENKSQPFESCYDVDIGQNVSQVMGVKYWWTWVPLSKYLVHNLDHTSIMLMSDQ